MTAKRIVSLVSASLLLVFMFVSCSEVYTDMILRKAAERLYKVSFDSNGGEGGQGYPVSVAVGQKMPDLSAGEPTYAGHYFAGYFDKIEGGMQYYSTYLKSIKLWDKSSDSLLYAQWANVPLCTITFYSNIGSGNLTEIQQIPQKGSSLLKGNVFSRTGYVFSGWNSKADGTGTDYSDGEPFTMGVSDIVLYAQWELGEGYPITYRVGNSSRAIKPVQFKITDLPLNLPALPVEIGYVIDGWYEKSDYTGNKVTNIPAITGFSAKVFYAKKIPNTYKVAFDGNGGSGTMAVQEFSYGVSAKLSNNMFTRDENYVFIDWHLNATCSDQDKDFYANEAQFSVPAHDITLYAHWVKNAIPIRYFTVTGSVATSFSAGLPTFFSTETPLPLAIAATPAEAGYTIEGWYENENCSGEKVMAIPAGASLTEKFYYAKKTANTYTVTFEPNGGVGTMAVQSIVFDSNTRLNRNVFNRSGYVFTGWNSSISGNGDYFADERKYVRSENIVLYAQWKMAEYSITYFVNEVKNELTPTVFNAKTALPLSLAAPPETDGYDTVGWYENENYSGEKVMQIPVGTVLENKNYYAKRTPQNYTVTFDANGGTGTMDAQEFIFGVSKNLSANTFTKNGRTFEGWTLISSGKGMQFKNEASYMAVKKVTLYAIWALEKFAQSDYNDPSFKEFDVYNSKQLESIAELAKIAGNRFTGKTIILQGDIDFNGKSFSGIGGGANYVENALLREFDGTFDGQGFVVKNMHIKADAMGIGFIGNAAKTAVIKNFGIDASCSITGRGNVGGIVGALSGTVENCYNAASVTAISGMVGGIAGQVSPSAKIRKTYNIGLITNKSISGDGGGIVGYITNPAESEISASYYLEGVSKGGVMMLLDPVKYPDPVEKRTAVQFADQKVFNGWDFANTWKMGSTGNINGVGTRPLLREVKPVNP